MNPARKKIDTTTYSGRLAKRLHSLRVKAGYSVEDVVERMQKFGFLIKPAAYRHWENGTRKTDLDAIPAIAKSLKVKVLELLPKT